MNTFDPKIRTDLPYFGPYLEYATLFFCELGFNDSDDSCTGTREVVSHSRCEASVKRSLRSANSSRGDA